MFCFTEFLLQLFAFFLKRNYLNRSTLEVDFGEPRAAKIKVVEGSFQAPGNTWKGFACRDGTNILNSCLRTWVPCAMPWQSQEQALLVKVFALLPQRLQDRCPRHSKLGVLPPRHRGCLLDCAPKACTNCYGLRSGIVVSVCLVCQRIALVIISRVFPYGRCCQREIEKKVVCPRRATSQPLSLM